MPTLLSAFFSFIVCKIEQRFEKRAFEEDWKSKEEGTVVSKAKNTFE